MRFEVGHRQASTDAHHRRHRAEYAVRRWAVKGAGARPLRASALFPDAARLPWQFSCCARKTSKADIVVARILIVTPAEPGSRKGNRVTAQRWSRMLRKLGLRLEIAQHYIAQSCDLMLALHARRSARSIARFARQCPDKPLLVALTGTDLYDDVQTNEAAQRSLELATRLVLLQPHGLAELARRLRLKAEVILQSAEPPTKRLPALRSAFEVCVAGHLRPVKDPFRAALAARLLPASSRIKITHLGAALTPSMARRAQAEMDRNSRYRWWGDVPAARARQLIARARLFVLSSKMEGGANVLSEAIVAGVPALASRISGSLGMLGDDYPGYFGVAQTRQLADLMLRCERDAKFYNELRRLTAQRAPLFRPDRELSAWRNLLESLTIPVQ